MTMVETKRIQCIFLDVVKFTVDRSVEAQADVVNSLNSIVRRSMSILQISSNSRILLPTGDGMSIALTKPSTMDLHLRLGLEILKGIAKHNKRQTDKMRQYAVRIGINENIDNIVLDINGRRNVAGDGISLAQRIMDNADPGQILVSQSVHDTLRHREKYIDHFRHISAKGKHGIQFPAYQFRSSDAIGLNNEAVSSSTHKATEPQRLTRFVAYYLAHALPHQDFFQSRKVDPVRDYAAILLLSLLAEDSIEDADTPSHEEPDYKTWNAGLSPFEEQYKHYYSIEFWPLCMIADYLIQKHLAPYEDLFEHTNKGFNKCYCIVQVPTVEERLKLEWPEVEHIAGITRTANKAMEPTVARRKKRKKITK